jgi:beta-lactamase class A
MLTTMLALALTAAAPDPLSIRWELDSRPARGRVGAAALLVESGRTVTYHDEDRYPMQSVYKLPIAMAVLHMVDRQQLTLAQPITVSPSDICPRPAHSPLRDRHPGGQCVLNVRELVRMAMVESDGTASDVLMRLAGGAPGVMRYLDGLGIRGIQVATTEREMQTSESVQYRNWARPSGLVQLLKMLQERRALTGGSTALLLSMMRETRTGIRRIRALLPGLTVADKTGTSRTVTGMTAATNDAGLITLPDGRHLAVVVLVSDSAASAAEREGVIARMSRSAHDRWNRPSHRTR